MPKCNTVVSAGEIQFVVDEPEDSRSCFHQLSYNKNTYNNGAFGALEDCVSYKKLPIFLGFNCESNSNEFLNVDFNQTKKIIENFNTLILSENQNLIYKKMEWPLVITSLTTDFDVAPAINKLDHNTINFIKDNELTDSILWLQESAPKFFQGAEFEITTLSGDEGNGTVLALKVYSDFPTGIFREKRHEISEEMLTLGYTNLYDVISIFQRRVTGNGWETLSWYSTLSKK